MSDILGKLNELDGAIGDSQAISHRCAQASRAALATIARDIAADMGKVAPKPSTALAEARPKASGQDEAGYLPVKRNLSQADR